MLNTFLITIAFWWKSIKKAAADAWDDLGLLGGIIALAISVIVTMQEKQITDISQFDFESLVLTARYLILIWVFFSFMFLLRNVAREDSGKSNEIQGLNKRLNIEARVEIEAWNPAQSPQWAAFAGILIRNARRHELFDVEVYATSLTNVQTNEEILRTPEPIRWSALNQPITGAKRLRGKGILYVDAFAAEDVMILCSQRGDMYPLGPGNYEVELLVGATYRENGIERKFRGRVVFNGRRDIAINKIQ